MAEITDPYPSFSVASNETRYPTALPAGSVTAADSIYKGTKIAAIMGYLVEVVGTVKATLTFTDHGGTSGETFAIDLVTPAAANPQTNVFVQFGGPNGQRVMWTGIKAAVENAGAWRVRVYFRPN